MSSSRKNNIQRWKLDWEIHSSKHFSKPTSLRAESSISNPTEKSNYHNLFNHIRRWNIWSETKVWSKEVHKGFRSLKVQVFLRRPHRFGPSSTYNLTLLSNVKKRVEDWPNFCGLLRIFELCYFLLRTCGSQKASYFHLYEPSFSKKYRFLKIKLVSTYLDKEQT